MELLSIDNYILLKPWIQKANWKEYNSNIVTMLMWNKSFPIYFQIYSHFALVCFMRKKDKHWFMPFCEKQHLKEATDTLITLSKEEHIPLSVHSITQEYKDFLEVNYPNQVYFEHHEVAEDYVYDRSQQETLSGKKMQKRRNHFNAFLKEHENRYEYHDLNKEDIPQVYELIEVWKKNKEDGESETIKEEEAGIRFLLDHFDELELMGGCIYIDNVLEAFSIASLISDDMIQIHIEKANKNFRGLYVAILKLLLTHMQANVKYVNREDDMGLPYLRKAKHDMRPIFKVKKYLAIFGDVTIKHPESEEELYQMQDIWQSRFEDESIETTSFFFNHILKKEYAYLIRNPKEVMGMAYINPWKIQLENSELDAFFLEGVAIEEDYEGCGLMKKLVTHILSAHKNKQFALQAYNWDIYRPLGFEETHYIKETILDKTKYKAIEDNFTLCNDVHLLKDIYDNYCSDKEGYRLRDEKYYEEYYLPYMKACGYEILAYQDKGYVCLEKNEDECIVHEIYYRDTSDLDKMLQCLSAYHEEIRITSDVNAKIEGFSNIKIELMMNPSIQKENLFLNEIM